MLHKYLLRLILKIIYYYSLLIGLFPAPFNWETLEFQRSTAYLCYSGVMHCICLGVVTYLAIYFYEIDYMTIEPLLQWTYTVTNMTKILAIYFLVKETWSKREQLIDAVNAYCELTKYYRKSSSPSGDGDGDADNGADDVNENVSNANAQNTRRIERYLIIKFFISITFSCMIGTIFLKMHPGDDILYLSMIFISFLLNTFLLTVTMQFFYALCQLYRQLGYVNVALRDLQQQLHALHRRFPVATAATTAPDNERPQLKLLSLRLSTLAAMHFDCYCLAQRIFRIGETATVAIMLRIFVTNIRNVYNTIMLVSNNFATDAWTLVYGIALTIFFYWDVMLLMVVVEGVLNTCNETGQIMRECCDLLRLRDADQLMHEMDQFSNHLRCNKLTFKVCGLFEFNKQSSLRYFLTVFVQVTVLVQFDLKNNL